MDIVEQFRAQYYRVELAYLLLRNEQDSINRVKTRVKKGGHNVSLDSISTNYHKGLKNLDFFCDRFDSVILLDAAGAYGDLDPLLIYKDRQLIYEKAVLPKWARKTALDLSLRIETAAIQNLRITDNDQNTRKQGPKR